MKNGNYETTDLGMASYLYTKGFQISDVKEDPNFVSGRKVIFFERKPGHKIEDEVEKFLRREAQVEPKSYFHAIKEVKNMIYHRI